MSLQSMTGFGRAELEGENFSLTIEMKSVNNRYKDFRFKMGSVFNSKEIALKKSLEKSFQRGSFDIFINYKKSAQQKGVVDLDTDKIQSYLDTISQIAAAKNFPLTIQPTEFLRSDFYKEDNEKEEELNTMLEECFPKAVEQLMKSREEEGSKLVETLKKHKDQYQVHYQKVKELRNDYQQAVKEKLEKRFESQDIAVDEPRFMQEVIYYLEKLDIDEEINRIEIHLNKLENLLQQNKEVGRQIDFLMQELNRETNTIGSKSGHQLISENVVQMKVQLEKIREQALNLQ